MKSEQLVHQKPGFALLCVKWELLRISTTKPEAFLTSTVNLASYVANFTYIQHSILTTSH